MSFLSKLFGGTAAQPIEALGNVFDKVFTSDDERLKAQAVLDKIAMQPTLLQNEINKIEASHRSVFVAGWRPFIGWVCGSALAYNFIFRDLLVWLMYVYGQPCVGEQLVGCTPLPPALQMAELMSVLMGLLGLGTLRTFEKIKGKAK